MMSGNWDLAVFFNTEVSEVQSFTEGCRYFPRTAMIQNSLFDIHYSSNAAALSKSSGVSISIPI